jgi:F-type H+-transporting ATPase subunit b
MEETLRQLGDLLLGAIPTVILFLILLAAYRALVHTPLARLLAERRRRTEGALEKARADIAAAEARTAEYEHSLREARTAILKAQEGRRAQMLQAGAAAVAEARAVAGNQIKQAKAALAQEATASRESLQAEAERLAAEIVDCLLRPVGAVYRPAEGGQ